MARFKYAAVVEGNCAALRLKRLLGSPSAVLLVQSDEAEWFTPLLVPWVHYIPVGFVADARPQQVMTLFFAQDKVCRGLQGETPVGIQFAVFANAACMCFNDCMAVRASLN